MHSKPRIHVLTGCTACGKTAAALAWARQHGAEIVSCDSLLFYRGMDIGTAKPSAAEREHVPHHLIDVLPVTARMDVRRYVERARAVVTDLTARGRGVLVTGGSGFYLRSFFGPVTDDVEADMSVRTELERVLLAEGLPALVSRLAALNPGGLAGFDVKNPRRVVRALERCLVSGRTLADLQRAFRAQPPPFAGWDVRLVELTREPEDLRGRIQVRAQTMIQAGLIDEVCRLRAAGLEQNPSAARAIGYRETLAWLDAGLSDQSQLTATIARNTWRLVRKQRTWFGTQLPPHETIALREGEEAKAERLIFP